MTVLVYVAVGVCGHDDAEIGGLLDLFGIQYVEMPDHPALVGDVDRTVYLLGNVEKTRADNGKANTAARRFDHEFDYSVLRHTVVVVETRPAGIGRGGGTEDGVGIHPSVEMPPTRSQSSPRPRWPSHDVQFCMTVEYSMSLVRPGYIPDARAPSHHPQC